MTTLRLSQPFDFTSDDDWDWVVTKAEATEIVIENGVQKQVFTGSFSFSAAGVLSGTATATTFLRNNVEVYSVTGMQHDAARLAVYAENEGDTQETYAFVLDGADTITGSAGNDGLMGYGGNDTINAGAGNDIMAGGAGNDAIAGEAGRDSAGYMGAKGGYSIVRSGGTITVTDQSGAEGVDTLTGIERLIFTDTALAFDVDGTAGQTYRLYQAAFGRVPDLGGLSWWIRLADDGMSMAAISQAFTQSPEFLKMYANATTSTAIVDLFYENVLHRDGEEAGMKWWTGLLDNKTLTVSEVLTAFADGPENQAALVGVLQAGVEFTPLG